MISRKPISGDACRLGTGARAVGGIGGVGLSLDWKVFDGGARSRAMAEAQAAAAAARARAASASALLDSAGQSYAAALESYNFGLRSLLDVTAAQQTLAQARSADVLARTQALAALADRAFQTGDSIQSTPRAPQP